MAKLQGFLKVAGTLEGVSIYETQDGFVVKKKWGPDATRLKRDPAYKAIRQHQSEFAACTKAAKLLRDCLMPVLEGSLDNRVSSRLNKVMNAVKNLDDVSRPGKRRVSKGFAHAAGLHLLNGFQFNTGSPLDQVLRTPYRVSRKQQDIRLAGLHPKQDLRVPKGATHAVLQCGLAVLDFDAKTMALKEDSVVLPIKAAPRDVVLRFKTSRLPKGLKVLVLKLAFLQEVGGEQLPLNDRRYNAVAVVDAWV